MSELISELDGGDVSSKETAVFGEPSGYTKCKSCAAKTKNQLL